MTDFRSDLQSHTKRVNYLEWHPTASDILLSAGADFQVDHSRCPPSHFTAEDGSCNKVVFCCHNPQCIVWNTRTSDAINVISVHRDTIFSVSWNRNGSLFATTCKDKWIRVIDPRTGNIVAVCFFLLPLFSFYLLKMFIRCNVCIQYMLAVMPKKS